MPAWLVSFLLHLIALMILALILLPQLAENPSITLSTFVAADDTEGGDIRMENPQDELQDDLPLAQQLAEDDEEIRDVIQKADQDAKQLLIDPLPTNPRPDLDVVKKNITTRTGPVFSFAARDPRVRRDCQTRRWNDLDRSRRIPRVAMVGKCAEFGWQLELGKIRQERRKEESGRHCRNLPGAVAVFGSRTNARAWPVQGNRRQRLNVDTQSSGRKW